MDRLKIGTVLAGFLLVHAGVALAIPLVDDEAYYALWASAAAWGYYDHPPMIAWWIDLGQRLAGHSVMGVRLVSVLAYGLAGLLVARIGWLVGGAAAGYWAALFFNTMPLIFVMGMVATPDAPSVLFWTGALWAVTEWSRGGSRYWWLAVGAFVALGVLSKFTNLFLCLGLAGWLAFTGEGRRALGQWQAWAGAMLAVLMLVPYALWNLENDGLGLELQFGRIRTGAIDPTSTLEYLLLAVLAITPLVLLLAIKGMRQRGVSLLVWTTLPLLAYMAWHSLTQHVAPNWLTPVYPALAVLAGLAAPQAAAWMRRAAAPLALAIGAVPLVYMLWHGSPTIPGNSPFNQIRGWDDALPRLREVVAAHDVGWIATRGYPLTGTLWWLLGNEIEVWATNEPKRYLFRGTPPSDLCQQPALQARSYEGPPREGAPPDAVFVSRMSGDRAILTIELEPVEAGEVCPAGL